VFVFVAFSLYIINGWTVKIRAAVSSVKYRDYRKIKTNLEHLNE